MGIQLTMTGERQRKKFTARQKLEILREWESTGNGVDVSRQHGIHPMTLYRWRKRLEQGAAEFPKGSRAKSNGVVFSPGRVSRPTDNARQERFYRTLKQEEVYCHDGYLSLDTARSSIGHWIEYYNEVRPHQALFAYPPAFVHRLGNKTQLLEEYRSNVEKAQEKRKQERILHNQKPTTFFTGNV